MSNFVITVADKKPPTGRAKTWKVYDSTGKMWLVWPEKADEMQIGANYVINRYSQRQWNNQNYNTIDEFSPAGGAAQAMPQQATNSPYQQAPQQTTAAPTYRPAPVSDNKDEHIFVCGALNNIMANPNTPALTMTVTERIRLVNDLRTTWRNTFGGQQSADDMSDEIPL